MFDKEKFVKRRHFAWPRDSFLEIKLSARNALKIQEWVKNGDDVQIIPHYKWRFIVLKNETKREGKV
jgi:hypothetical protein